MINPDCFFPQELDTTGMDFLTVFIIKNMGVIEVITVVILIIVMWVWFWNFTKNWSVNNEA